MGRVDLVKKANQANIASLAAAVIARCPDALSICLDSVQLPIKFVLAKQLPFKQKTAIVALFEANMREMYEQSEEGYYAKEKRDELFHPASRFALIEDSKSKLVGYTMFRFDWEENAEGDSVEVIYCYELQVGEQYKRKGIARKLTTLLHHLAQAYQMQKILLTAFKFNQHAIAFYTSQGYAIDENSPSKFDLNVDYEILSKPAQRLPGIA